MEAGNKYITEVYVPRHNEQFCVKPSCDKSAFTPWISSVALEDILCLEANRTVQHDNTVRYGGLILQIPKSEHRYHYVKAEVMVHEYFDGQLAIFYGPLCIGRYDKNGVLKNNNEEMRAGLPSQPESSVTCGQDHGQNVDNAKTALSTLLPTVCPHHLDFSPNFNRINNNF